MGPAARTGRGGQINGGGKWWGTTTRWGLLGRGLDATGVTLLPPVPDRVVTTGQLDETRGEVKGLFSPHRTRGPNFGIHRAWGGGDREVGYSPKEMEPENPVLPTGAPQDVRATDASQEVLVQAWRGLGLAPSPGHSPLPLEIGEPHGLLANKCQCTRGSRARLHLER